MNPPATTNPPRAWPRVLLVAAFIVSYILFLGVRPLFIPDEVRYGEIAREMLVSGDWIVPHLNGLVYFEKPPLGHWLNAISLSLFGENAFGVRFMAALSSGISALSVYILARLLFEERHIAEYAVLIFLTTFAVQTIGTFSVLDPIFSALLTLAILTFVVASTRRRRIKWAALGAAGLLFGLAFLTKGFLALVLPVLVLAPWLLVQKRFRLLFVESWLVVAVAVATILPWALAIHMREPDFWRYFFWVEHVQRFAADNAQHKEPAYFYLVFLPVVAFPWIFFLPAAVRALQKFPIIPRVAKTTVLLACWLVIPFIFFSLANGKLLTYLLPCFVPLSVIIAAGWSRIQAQDRWANAAANVLAILLSAGLLGLIYVQLLADGVPKYRSDEGLKFILLLLAMLGAMSTAIVSRRTFTQQRKLIVVAIGMLGLLGVLPWAIPAVALETKAPEAFIRDTAQGQDPGLALVTNGSFVRAVSWALKRNDVYVVDDGGETRYGLGVASGRGRFLNTGDFSDLLHDQPAVLLLCKGPCSDDTTGQLPGDTKKSSYGNFSAYLVAREQGQPAVDGPDARFPPASQADDDDHD